MKRVIRTVAMLTGIAAGIASLAPALQGAEVVDPNPISKLLKDAAAEAAQICSDAAALKAYSRQGKVDWASRAGEIGRMKSDTQVILQTAGKLKDSRAEAVPWQADVEEKILPLMQELSDTNTSAIELLSSNQAETSKAAECRSYIEVNSDLSKHLSGLIVHLIDYGSGLGKFESAKRALEMRIELSSR